MTPREYAERALLGSVLLDPDQLAHLDYLEPRDFYRPQHGELFAAMRRQREAGKAPKLAAMPAQQHSEALTRWATDVLEHAQVRGVDLPYLHTLMSSAPQPDHARQYGRMVLEADIHRTVGQHALRLSQAGTGELDVAFEMADQVRKVFDHLARRWGVPNDPPPDLDHPAWPPMEPPRNDRQTVTEPEDDERMLVAALMDHPDQLEEVGGWLREDDFAHAQYAAMYAAAAAVHAHGEPVDSVTVVWELHRREAWTEHFGPDQAIAQLTQPSAGHAVYHARNVLQASIRRTTARAARRIFTLAERPRLRPHHLIAAAQADLATVRGERARWQRAEPPESPYPPRRARRPAQSPAVPAPPPS